ncbi:MAG: asparagine synthase (glutamine-hydrolyzing) [Geobacteraceae bacterium GWC2_58_44]|nr:MAG: asparagine synthase (glutamine-hydrolyzing) [Geobacteraceae bacterium GWC2_58_44]HBG07392.1 asparagine synthase (glutamine-hydrolyzing) [Geobacter sp.]
MCGIVGIIDRKNGIDPPMLKKMADCLAHRGPDAEGFLFFDKMRSALCSTFTPPAFAPTGGFGHRRLSIIDLSGGAQPLGNEDGTVWVTYNGEIYNHLQLREELKGFGHQFRTDHSDTEIIVHAYEQWGVEAFDRFNGIFAFGIVDLKLQKLLLARDHFGVKPLYYYFSGGRFMFSSEAKAILHCPSVARHLDLQALSDYLSFRYVPSPLTTFKGIFKLEAGAFLEFDMAGNAVLQSASFRSATAAIDHSKKFPQWVSEYQDLFERSVTNQLISDVEIGVLLSGGIDSSAVCSIAAKHLDKQIRTYTVGFKDFPSGNEIDEATEFARHLGTIHKNVIIDDLDFITVLDQVAYFMDEPTATSSAIPLYYLTKQIKNDVKVVLTGQGADEPLAGYPRYRGERLYHSGFGHLGCLQPMIERLPRQERLKRAFRSFSHHDAFDRFMAVYYLFSPVQQAALLKEPIPCQANPLLERLFKEYQADDALGRMLYMDTRAWLPDDLLIYGDKATMINSIEARVPILDKELIRFIESMPSKYKLSFLLKGKFIHKKACEKWLPPFVIKRPKKGFDTPIDKWFRNELGGYVRDQLLGGTICRRLFNASFLEEMMARHREGKENFQRHLFALLMLEKWAQRYRVDLG